MRAHRRAALVLSAGWLVASVASAQSVDLIDRQLNQVRDGSFQLGPFFVTPSFQLSSGYDSNVLSTPAAESDVTARVGPAVRISAPIGSAAYFRVEQSVDYVYYREQIDLRRWFDTTRVGAGFGGNRFLVDVSDEFRHETGRPTSEFDFPVQQRTNQLDAALTFALGWRHELELGYTQARFEIVDGIEDEVVRARLNRVQDRFALQFRRHVTAKTTALAEGFFDDSTFDDSTRDYESSGARFGFEFTPGGDDPLNATPWGRAFVSGRFLLGFRSVAPLNETLVDYTGLIGSVDVVFGFGGGHGLQGIYSRDLVPSIFQDNWYFVEDRWGASFRLQITERLSVTPGVTFGRNDYPLSADGEELTDEHRAYRVASDYRVTEHWTVGVNVDYLDRTSNVILFGKERLQVGLNMAFRP